MKELKFRAWDKKRKEWLGVNLHMSVIDGCLYWQFGYACEILSRGDAGRIELMQYTGKKDKNGEGIYRGHILKYEDKSHRLSSGVYLVEWSDEECGFICERQEPYNYLLPSIWHKCEIIGNIFENPEPVGATK